MFIFFKTWRPLDSPLPGAPEPPLRDRRRPTLRAAPEAARRARQRFRPRRSPIRRGRAGLDGAPAQRAAAEPGSGIAQVFTGTQIDEALYEELEAALLMADAGVKATEFLLADLKRRVQARRGDRADGGRRACSADAIAELLQPLERALQIGEHVPTVIMVVGVNGAGKTTTIGKLTRHLAERGAEGAARRGRHLPRRGARAACASGPGATGSRSSARRAATRRP